MSKTEVQGFDISSKSAAVIGCGGLGCNVCVHLAGAGIGRLYICDFDTISESNLNRQFIYSSSQTGRKKTDAMKEFLHNYAPDTEIVTVDGKIEADSDLVFAKDCDVMVLAVDNNETRHIANDFCRARKIPVVSGGISGFFGNCYMYVPGKTPCLECAGLITKNSVKGNISSTAGIIGALSSELAIRYLTGDSSPSGKLLVYDNNEIQSLEIKASADCGCI